MTAENEQVYIPGHVDKVLLPLWDASNKLFLANFIVNFVKFAERRHKCSPPIQGRSIPAEMGVRSWFRVPELPRSRVPGILGTRARGNANFIQERGNAERERIGTLNSRSSEEMTQL